MKITEKALLSNLRGINNAGNLISVIDKIYYYWGYASGTGEYYHRVLYRKDAESIRIECVNGNITSIPLPSRCMCPEANKKAQQLISDFEKSLMY